MPSQHGGWCNRSISKRPATCINVDNVSFFTVPIQVFMQHSNRMFSKPSTFWEELRGLTLIEWTSCAFHKVGRWHFSCVVDNCTTTCTTTFVKFLQDSVYQKLLKSVYFWRAIPQSGSWCFQTTVCITYTAVYLHIYDDLSCCRVFWKVLLERVFHDALRETWRHDT